MRVIWTFDRLPLHGVGQQKQMLQSEGPHKSPYVSDCH